MKPSDPSLAERFAATPDGAQLMTGILIAISEPDEAWIHACLEPPDCPFKARPDLNPYTHPCPICRVRISRGSRA